VKYFIVHLYFQSASLAFVFPLVCWAPQYSHCEASLQFFTRHHFSCLTGQIYRLLAFMRSNEGSSIVCQYQSSVIDCASILFIGRSVGHSYCASVNMQRE